LKGKKKARSRGGKTRAKTPGSWTEHKGDKGGNRGRERNCCREVHEKKTKVRGGKEHALTATGKWKKMHAGKGNKRGGFKTPVGNPHSADRPDGWQKNLQKSVKPGRSSV